MTRFQGLFVLGWVASMAIGCGSETPDPAPTEPAEPALSADCRGEGDQVQAGLTKTGSAGYTFELLRLEPAAPVQTSKPPGNVWSVAIRDGSGAPASGTLLVSGAMPLHNNHPVSTPVAIEVSDGVYDLQELLLPMPGLYSFALSFTSEVGDKDSVSLLLCMSVKSG